MANQERGELGVTVDGQRYTLRPDFNALCALEDLTGKTFENAGTELATGIAPNSAIRRMSWCLLQPRHAAEIATLDDAGKWVVKAGGASVVMGWINQLFAMFNASEDGTDAKNPPEAQDGTGERSSLTLTASA